MTMERSSIELIDPPIKQDQSMMDQSCVTIEVRDMASHVDDDYSSPSMVSLTDESEDSDAESAEGLNVPSNQLKNIKLQLNEQRVEEKAQRSRFHPEVMAETVSTDCMADCMVKFLCPFDQCLARNTETRFDTMTAGCTDFELIQPSAVQNGDWLNSMQTCIPEQWEGNTYPIPETTSSAKVVVLNRASASQREEKKGAYFDMMRKKWHSKEPGVPIRKTRSSGEPDKAHRARQFSSGSAQQVYYDSDPDYTSDDDVGSLNEYNVNLPLRAQSERSPKHKQRRPTFIDTSPMALQRGVAFPTAPRNADERQRVSFFPENDSPRSVNNTDMHFDRNASKASYYEHRRQPNFSSDQDVRRFIEEVSESNFQLIWHQPSKSGASLKTKATTPLSVTAWFEYGAQLDATVVFPKLVWRPTYQPDLKQKILTATTNGSLNFIQLLTIVRIVIPQSINREEYPFARLDRSFSIITHEGSDYLFECSKRSERDWFVSRFKVLVARLASSVIVHDEPMLREFFVHTVNFPPADDCYTK